MKQFKIYIALLVVLIGASVTAQEVTEFMVNGLKVIHKPSVKEVISAKLFIKGGVYNYSQDYQGIEALTLGLLTQSGTNDMATEAFNAKLESMGTGFSSAANYDYATLSLTCLKQFWNESWDLYSSAICNSAFDESEFETIKQQMIATAQQAETDPDTHLRNSAMKNTFGGTAYENLPQGTVETLTNLTLDQVKDYYKMTRGTDKMYLVVVGNVDAKDLKDKIASSLSCIVNKPAKPRMTENIVIENSKYEEESREIATNYMRGLMNAPAIGHEDEVAMRVAMSIMGDRMFKEVRTKRNLSYAPAAFFPSGILAHPYTALYVSTDHPNEAAKVMLDEVRKVRLIGFEDTELIHKKGQFLTGYYMGQETVGSQAESLGKAEVIKGWEATQSLMDDVNALTTEDINKVFKKYTKNISWTYLGDTELIDKDIFLAPLAEEKVVEKVVKRVTNNKAKPKKKSKKTYGF